MENETKIGSSLQSAQKGLGVVSELVSGTDGDASAVYKVEWHNPASGPITASEELTLAEITDIS
jgi:hypothetical protein